jgi:hypothetical protein
MYRGLSIVAIAPVLDEEIKIGHVIRRTPRDVVDEVVVVDGRAEFVQGSRWLKRGANFGQMPYCRRIATRVHPARWRTDPGTTLAA